MSLSLSHNAPASMGSCLSMMTVAGKRASVLARCEAAYNDATHGKERTLQHMSDIQKEIAEVAKRHTEGDVVKERAVRQELEILYEEYAMLTLQCDAYHDQSTAAVAEKHRLMRMWSMHDVHEKKLQRNRILQDLSVPVEKIEMHNEAMAKTAGRLEEEVSELEADTVPPDITAVREDAREKAAMAMAEERAKREARIEQQQAEEVEKLAVHRELMSTFAAPVQKTRSLFGERYGLVEETARS